MLTILFITSLTYNCGCQSEEEIVIKSSSFDIHGSLLTPATNTDYIALIIAGSGPTDRNGNNLSMVNNSLKMMAEGLAAQGIASLRYDKRGIAASKIEGMNERDIRFEHIVEDAEAWVDYIKQDKKYKHITIIGHSEGALIGAIAAKKAEVNQLVSLAGTGEPAQTIIRKQLHDQAPILLKIAEPYLVKLENGITIDTVPALLNSLFRPSVQPYMMSWFKYYPAVEIAKLNKPILVIQGNTDIQVPVDNAEILAAANPNALLQVVNGMNHILKTAEMDRIKNIATYSMPGLPLTEGFLDHIISFIKQD